LLRFEIVLAVSFGDIIGLSTNAGQLLLQILVAYALPPQLFGFSKILGIGLFASADRHTFVGGKLEFLSLKQVGDVIDALFESFQKPAKNLHGRRSIRVASPRRQ